MSGWCALVVLSWVRPWLYQKLAWAAGALLTSSLNAESVSDSIVSRHQLVTGFVQAAGCAGRVYGLLGVAVVFLILLGHSRARSGCAPHLDALNLAGGPLFLERDVDARCDAGCSKRSQTPPARVVDCGCLSADGEGVGAAFGLRARCRHMPTRAGIEAGVSMCFCGAFGRRLGAS